MSGPTSATFEDSDEDLVHGPVTRSRGKLLEKIGSLISLSNRSVTIADSEEIKSRTSTKGGKKRQKRARSPSRSASLPPQKVLHTLSTISEGFEGERPSISIIKVRQQKARIKIKIRRKSNSPEQPSPMIRRQAQAKAPKRSPRCLQVPVSLRQLKRTAEKPPERRAVGRRYAPSHPKKSFKPQLSPKNCGKRSMYDFDVKFLCFRRFILIFRR